MNNELKIEYIPIEKLKPYANNAKIHTGEQIDQIKKSIQEFGFNDPIAIWHDNEIIEGHGRLLAGIELGMTELPVIRLDNLSDEERRAYMLVHNQLTMNTGYDLDLLSMEIDNITQYNMDFYGFDIDSIEIEDIDSFIGKPEIEIARELGEANNYIVLEFNNEEDWDEAQRVFGLKKVSSGEKNERVRKYGIGRVIDGANVMERVKNED